MSIDLQTQMKRIGRDLEVFRRLRRQKRAKKEDTTEVTAQIDAMRKQAIEIRNQMEKRK